MANFTTLCLTDEQMKQFHELFISGYINRTGKKVRPNPRVAFALALEANLGLRISDVVQLRLDDIIKERDRYRLNITEQKTGKCRHFTINNDVYAYIQGYALEHGIRPNHKLVDVTTRTIQRNVKMAREHLGINGISTHSWRKVFATEIYEKSGKDLNMTRLLMNHSSGATTLRYLGVQEAAVEEVLRNHVKLI